MKPHAALAILASALLSAPAARANIISDAMLSFPAATESLEYDNLAALRALPNYQALRQRFAGEPLEKLKTSLVALGIDENQVTEIVMASSPAAFFGLAAGSFSGSAAAKTALKRNIIPAALDGNRVYCPPGGGPCVLFLEDSLAAFGTSGQLKKMLDARQGILPRLSSKPSLVYLIGKTDPRAPVRGFASGSQLESSLKDALQDQSGLNLDWSRLTANLSAFGYSVSLDNKAHVSATLECTSSTSAAFFRQMLSALGGLQSVAASAGKDPAGMPFQNMKVSSAGNIVDLKMDAPVAGS